MQGTVFRVCKTNDNKIWLNWSGFAHKIHVSWLYYGNSKNRDTFVYKHILTLPLPTSLPYHPTLCPPTSTPCFPTTPPLSPLSPVTCAVAQMNERRSGIRRRFKPWILRRLERSLMWTRSFPRTWPIWRWSCKPSIYPGWVDLGGHRRKRINEVGRGRGYWLRKQFFCD